MSEEDGRRKARIAALLAEKNLRVEYLDIDGCYIFNVLDTEGIVVWTKQHCCPRLIRDQMLEFLENYVVNDKERKNNEKEE